MLPISDDQQTRTAKKPPPFSTLEVSIDSSSLPQRSTQICVKPGIPTIISIEHPWRAQVTQCFPTSVQNGCSWCLMSSHDRSGNCNLQLYAAASLADSRLSVWSGPPPNSETNIAWHFLRYLLLSSISLQSIGNAIKKVYLVTTFVTVATANIANCRVEDRNLQRIPLPLKFCCQENVESKK